ncbi:hypothetical protein RvY_19353-2 [Ramazzottius varieornatus]|nr:hypothetical protein RvY_19353-2 [Ramazzottius varieornatus]
MDIWTSAATALTGQLTLLHSGLEATRAQYAAVTAEREEVQRQNRRLLREVAALRRGTPYPVEQPPTSDASTSTEASVYANASTSTKQVVMVSSSTSTDGVSGFLLRKALLSCLFRQGVEHLLGIIPVGLGRRRLLCSFLESFHLLEELDELVWNRADGVNVDDAGRTLHRVMAEKRWSRENPAFHQLPCLLWSPSCPRGCLRSSGRLRSTCPYLLVLWNRYSRI